MTHQKPAGLAPALGVVRPANSQAASQQVYDLANVDQQSLEKLEWMADEWVNRLQDVKVRPAFRINTAAQVTLEPCTKCRQMAVCLPVAGRHGRRSYPYCVETCWPLARAASETVVKTVPASARPSMRCSCCGEFAHVLPVILAGNRLTSLFFCEATCWSDRLATLDMVPTCSTCGRYLQPNEYVNGKCGVCK
ncbi:hypothetical protein [Aeromonas caviae]